jgi:FtsZ-interacting cell division protein ZipA
METWLIVVIVLAVVIALVLIGLSMAKRGRAGEERKRELAREHLHEAQLRGTRAEKEEALGEEQAARARRERAEVEERAMQAEREAQERAGRAQEDRSAAQQLKAKAESLDPGLRQDDSLRPSDTGPIHRPDAVAAEEPVRRDETGGSGTIRR